MLAENVTHPKHQIFTTCRCDSSSPICASSRGPVWRLCTIMRKDGLDNVGELALGAGVECEDSLHEFLHLLWLESGDIRHFEAQQALIFQIFPLLKLMKPRKDGFAAAWLEPSSLFDLSSQKRAAQRLFSSDPECVLSASGFWETWLIQLIEQQLANLFIYLVLKNLDVWKHLHPKRFQKTEAAPCRSS